MSTRQDFIDRIEQFCQDHDLSERQFGLQAVGNHKFFGRLRDGKATLGTIDRAEAFMRDWQESPAPEPEPEGEAA